MCDIRSTFRLLNEEVSLEFRKVQLQTTIISAFQKVPSVSSAKKVPGSGEWVSKLCHKNSNINLQRSAALFLKLLTRRRSIAPKHWTQGSRSNIHVSNKGRWSIWYFEQLAHQMEEFARVNAWANVADGVVEFMCVFARNARLVEKDRAVYKSRWLSKTLILLKKVFIRVKWILKSNSGSRVAF